MSVFAEMKMYVDPSEEGLQKGSEQVRKLEGQQGDAEEPALPNMRLSLDTAVLSTVLSPKSAPLC